MHRIVNAVAFLMVGVMSQGAQEKAPAYPSFDYDVVYKHELKPHRRTIPFEGMESGDKQIHLTLTVSPAGDVIDAKTESDSGAKKFWPEIEAEVRQWKFTPFENGGKAITAQVEEYADLVPPERLPKKHVAPPVLRLDSEVKISLLRTGCFGTCPSYKVTVNTGGIVFEGGGYLVAKGKHTAEVDASKVRELAQKFIAADFYSMDDRYQASVTDNPSYVLSIAIDGRSKTVSDYVGSWVGMPAVISDLEDEVDELAQTQRWINGTDAMVDALEEEKFNFKSYDAQVILKEAAHRGETDTVRSLLEAGVSLKPIPAPKPKEEHEMVSFEHEGWLTVAGGHPETLQVLIDAAASKNDQSDKDLALVGAAESGEVDSVRALVEYGGNPNVDLSKLTVTERGAGMTLEGQGAGSILIYAAASGNPAMVREILSYHAKLELRDREGKTAVFAAGEYRSKNGEGARVECVRLLAQAGADVNARDNQGNTPLHDIFLTDVEEELLELGADVNARNKDGETPIFTNVDDQSIPLFLKNGADLKIRNSKGQTVLEAAQERGPIRERALREAIEKMAAK
jgi:ankyrin repeat protein